MDKLWIIVILLPENTNMKNIKLMQVYRLLHINNKILALAGLTRTGNNFLKGE